MARASMADLITRLRLMIYDPAGASATFSDDDLQGFLDDHRTDVQYMGLEPIPTYGPGGTTSYLVYTAAVGNWEASVAIVDSDYESVSHDTPDYRRGKWTFGTSQEPPLYLTGSHYNLNLAAVAALEHWCARLKLSYDFTADGATFKRSQQLASMQSLIAQYKNADVEARGVQVMTMTRSDLLEASECTF